MELADYIRILRKRWILITGTVVIAVVIAGAATALMSPQYKATTQVFVSTSTDNSSASDLSAGNTFTSQRVKSYAQAVTTTSVLQPVIKTLDLPYTVSELAAKVSANAPLNTVILEISATDTDPTRAAAIANAVGETLPKIISDVEKPNAGGTSPVKISTLEAASVPTSPDSPNAKLNLALGLLLGLAIGVGIAILMEVLDTKVRNTRDVEAITDAAMVGGIPMSESKADPGLVVQNDPRSPLSEAFRGLRTNLEFVVAAHPKSVIVTSAMASEGKTTIASNLAIAISQSGSQVLVIDADLRRPRLSEAFGIEGAVGLTDVLIGNADLEDVVQPWGATGNIEVLPSGQIPPNPSELLGGNQMRELINAVEAKYDLVIFDCAPLLPVTDTAVLSKMVGGAVLVGAAGKTHKAQFSAAIKTLHAVGSHLFGVVLTMLPTKGFDAYTYSQYGHYGSYGDIVEPDPSPAADAEK
ncbi:polysaccharide biosynthesis tyrosine autokinase [Rarobacter incanus]|uniref:non-specific protein-tyrosine kinase n=1 Tax=Rarobacter incanus TaxID=153494 RepID=A0A542SMF2_9MICO|nr:polysaccharide biosynthesis tyrosine autokinase [Rarobacter incanus]TQK75748.1 capsular exopolysaccharide synthesis family protein [Rarobacter incanus]